MTGNLQCSQGSSWQRHDAIQTYGRQRRKRRCNVCGSPHRGLVHQAMSTLFMVLIGLVIRAIFIVMTVVVRMRQLGMFDRMHFPELIEQRLHQQPKHQ